MTTPPSSPRRSQQSRLTINSIHIAIVAIVVGLLMAGAGGVYLVVSDKALDSLNEFDVQVPDQIQDSWVTAPTPAAVGPTPTPNAIPTAEATSKASEPIVFNFSSVYPADQTNPRFWFDPQFAGTGPYGGPTLPEGFEFVSPLGTLFDANSSTGAKVLRIPAIDLVADVSELQILEEPDGARYEQPVNVVGHIPETPDPGQYGNGWYFGHLESPILGEGNIFRRLPEIADLIKNDPVDVIIETDQNAYLYRVTGTTIVPREDLTLYRSDAATVTLVASFPSRVYSHRFLVTAELLAARVAP